MTEPADVRLRIVAALALATAVAWQVYAAVSALRHGPVFVSLFAGLGSPLPTVTRAFIASYRYWWIVPGLFGGLSVDILRRREAPLAYFCCVLIASAAAAMTLHAWLYEALFTPLFEILRKVG